MVLLRRRLSPEGKCSKSPQPSKSRGLFFMNRKFTSVELPDSFLYKITNFAGIFLQCLPVLDGALIGAGACRCR